VITIMGPSKTESLSGYRLGVAFGAAALIDRMEKLQAIVSLRAPGYSQAVLRTWFEEPAGWMNERTKQHETIRDDLMTPGTEFCPDRTDSIRLNFSQNHAAAVHAAERIIEMIARYRRR
jgi:aspartate/methionine/tyrosine aminotransferase